MKNLKKQEFLQEEGHISGGVSFPQRLRPVSNRIDFPIYFSCFYT